MFSLEIETLARLLVDEARSRSLRIVTAESCTGGLVAGAICAVPGAWDLSGALALAALILFLMDVALNRLPWERALQNVRAAARTRAAKTIKAKKPVKAAPSGAKPDTASQLLSVKNTRKRL